MGEEDDMPEFLDAESYQGQNKNIDSFQGILYMQLARILTLGSKEFCGGYWIKLAKRDMVIERYIEDSRASYINAVQSLFDLLESYFEDDRKDKAGNCLITEPLNAWKTGAQSIEEDFVLKTEGIEDEDRFKNIQQIYMNRKAEHYRGLFRILSGFIKRKNNFKERRISTL